MDGNRADAQQPSARPNIVVIQADDLGYGDLSAYGQAMFQTPALDRLAREGIRFTQYYAGRTVCSPSRTSLMPRSTPAWVSCSSLPPLQPARHPRGARVAPIRMRAAVGLRRPLAAPPRTAASLSEAALPVIER